MDTKPILLPIISRGWDASSPLVYTIQRTLKYAHFGYAKHMNHLILKYGGDKQSYLQWHKDTTDKIFNNTWENYLPNSWHRLNTTTDLEPLKDFPLEHLQKFIHLDTDHEWIEFYLKLYYHVKSKGYKAVSMIGPHTIIPNIELLKQSFQVKPIILFRDPVRRAISKCLNKHNKVLPNMDEFFFDYINLYQRILSNFPNTLLITMEELWEGNQKQQLAEYLDHPVTELWPNLYSPDIGHHLKWNLDLYHCPTPCQPINQSSFIITPQYYNHLKDKYQEIYNNWINYFGSLPLHWGKPLDYDKNLENYPYYNPKYKYPLI